MPPFARVAQWERGLPARFLGTIALSRAVQQELAEAFRYYEQEQHGLGNRFLDDIEHAGNSSRNCMRGIHSIYRYGAVYCATFRTA